MEIPFHCKSFLCHHITTNLRTRHDSYAVMSCAKFRSDHFIRTWSRRNWNFHQSWIVMGKSWVKWVSVVSNGGFKRMHEHDWSSDVISATESISWTYFINPSPAEFMWGNIKKIYLHFLLFLNTERVQGAESLSHSGQRFVFLTRPALNIALNEVDI